MKIVVDTDAIIRAIFWRDKYGQTILRLAAKGYLQMVTSQRTENEILKVVMGHLVKAKISLAEARPGLEKLMVVLSTAKRVTSRPVFFRCKYKNDNKFFDCAIHGQAACIIAEDRDFGDVSNPPVPVF